MRKIFILFLLLNSVIVFAQSDEIETYIKKESINGELDFKKIAEKQAGETAFIAYDNIIYNKKDFAILLWAAKVKSLGIVSFEKTIALWEEINKRKLTDPEKKALKKGFEVQL